MNEKLIKRFMILANVFNAYTVIKMLARGIYILCAELCIIQVCVSVFCIVITILYFRYIKKGDFYGNSEEIC